MNISACLRKAAGTAAAATALVLLAASAASAHVTVSSPDAEPGGYGKLVFRVPSESDTAKTESITVQLPTETPFRSVSTRTMPGWTAETTTEKLPEPVEADGFTVTEAVTEVTWTAQPGAAIGPGQFQEFELSVGTFPEGVDQLVLPTVQTYSDGEVAKWTQPVVEGGAEPESPAPVLELGTADAAAETVDQSSAPVASASAGSAAGDTDDAADTVARSLGGLGLGLGAVALVWASVNRRKQRR